MTSLLRPIVSLLIGLLFLIIGHGIQMTLIPLHARAVGWSQLEIGAIGSAYYVGFVAGCFGAPQLIRRNGHIRAFTAMTALITVTMIAHPLWVAFWPWLILRLIIGACLAGLYMVLESWINEGATNANRGLVMSAYIMVNYAALALGQFAVTLASPLAFTLFALAAMAMSLAAIPLALTRQMQPAPVPVAQFRPLALYRLSPVGFIGATGAGVASGAFWTLGAVAAVGAGLTAHDAAIFLGLVTAAGALAQWPVGRASDRIDRRLVLIAILIAAAVIGLMFALLPISRITWLVLGVLFGATIAPMYSVSAAHAYDHADPGTTVETAAGLFVASASGSVIGPLIASAFMQALGTPRLFLFTAIVHLALAGYVILRVRTKAPLPIAQKTAFDLPAAANVPGGVPPEPMAPVVPPEGTEPELVDADPPPGVAG